MIWVPVQVPSFPAVSPVRDLGDYVHITELPEELQIASRRMVAFPWV